MFEVLMPIKDKLKKLRAAAGMTQQTLAVKAGLSVSAVVHIEAGRIPDPRVSTLQAIAGALGVTLNDLTDEPGQAEALPEPEPPKRRKPKK